MKKNLTLLFFSSMIFMLNSCDIIGGIFKAGVWSGIIIVILVVAMALWLISKFMGGRRN